MPYYSVRQCFVLDHNGKRYHPGQQIDLTEEEAKLYPHQIEPWISRKDKKKRARNAAKQDALELGKAVRIEQKLQETFAEKGFCKYLSPSFDLYCALHPDRTTCEGCPDFETVSSIEKDSSGQ
jgi:hypothetical protein